jgi:hypothetical protein
MKILNFLVFSGINECKLELIIYESEGIVFK